MRPDATVVVVPNFISDKEKDQLERLAIDYLQTGVLQPNGPDGFRFFKRVNGVDQGSNYCDLLIQQIGSRVIKTFGLEEYPIDPYLGWVVSLIKPGGFIHAHTDNYEHYKKTGDKHLRCNVLVSMENDSYMPVINNREVPVQSCGLWGFFPSDVLHETRTITGKSPRINYQFGFTVPGDYELKARHV